MSEIKRETPGGLVVQILADPMNRVPILVDSCIVAEAAANRARDLAEHYRTIADLQARELCRLQRIIDDSKGEGNRTYGDDSKETKADSGDIAD